MTGPTVAASAILRDEQGRVLLVQRGHEPGLGLWSLPGGRVEPGERPANAAVREVLEETGLHVTVRDEVHAARVLASDGRTYEIHCFEARLTGGTLQAGDDAAAAGWFALDELATLPVTDGLVSLLEDYGRRHGPGTYGTA